MGECWDGAAATPVVETGLRLLQSAIPPDWHELLQCGRTPPRLGEWVVIRPEDHHHQGATIPAGLQVGLVTGGGWVGERPYLWAELYSFSELRGFHSHLDSNRLISPARPRHHKFLLRSSRRRRGRPGAPPPPRAPPPRRLHTGRRIRAGPPEKRSAVGAAVGAAVGVPPACAPPALHSQQTSSYTACTAQAEHFRCRRVNLESRESGEQGRRGKGRRGEARRIEEKREE